MTLPPSKPSLRRLSASLLGSVVLTAHAECPALLVERFIPADCEACWRSGSAPAAGSVVLDWIVPSARGDDAPLSSAAVAEATARAGAPAGGATRQRLHALGRAGVQLSVEDGPAWNGYVGLRLRAARTGTALPEGAAGYLALAETLGAGDEGTPIARNVVRAVAGPLPLDGAADSTTHLVALRLTPGIRVDRLRAVAWVEDRSGSVFAVAQAGSADCTGPE